MKWNGQAEYPEDTERFTLQTYKESVVQKVGLDSTNKWTRPQMEGITIQAIQQHIDCLCSAHSTTSYNECSV